MAALTGVRVVDLSQMVGAPYCTQVLADLGADVIKVEEPMTALLTRVAVSPPGTPEARRFSSYWVATNRNKRSLTLDLRVVEARAVLADLVRESDVVVENFGARTLVDRWGSPRSGGGPCDRTSCGRRSPATAEPVRNASATDGISSRRPAGACST